MAQIVKLRRSSVSGQKPTNDKLQLGELAVNTTDGKVFFAKSGSLGPTIEEIVTTNTITTGSINLIGGVTASGDISGSNIRALSFIKSGGLSTQYLMADGSVSTLTNPVTGTGTVNYVPKFTASGTIGNSLIYDNGTNVGIGTPTPTHKLTSYVSSMNVGSDQTYPFFASVGTKGIVLGYDVANDSAIINGVETGTLWKNISIATYSNKVGIGTLSPSEKLDVIGNVKALSFIRSGGTSSQYLMADGSVSTLTNPVTGTGTTNYLSKFIGNTSLGVSTISDNGSTVTVNVGTNSSSTSTGALVVLGGVGVAGNVNVGGDLKVRNFTMGQGIVSQSIYLNIQNPGIGYGNGFNFQRGTDGAGINVIETGNDSTMYELWMSDNPDGGDMVQIRVSDWQSPNGLTVPIQTSGKTNRYVSDTHNFWGDISQNTTPFYTTSTVGGVNGSNNQLAINNISMLRVTGNIVNITNFNVTNYTGNSGSLFWIRLDSTTTFAWGYGWSSGTATETGIALSTSAITLTNGIQVTFNGTTGSVGDTFEARVYRRSYNTLGPTSVVGDVGIGTTSPSEKLDVNGYVKASGFKTPSGTSSQYLMADGSVSTLTNPVTGTGTTNYIPKFTASGTIGNSLIFDNGTNLGIGTTTPNSKLDVNGNTTLSGSLMVSQSLIQYSSVASVPSGSVIDVASFNTGSYTATFFDFVITSGSNTRAGTIFTTWNGNNIEYTETSTNDIGNTTSLQLSTSLSAGSVKLRATSIMGSWSVKTLARMI